MPRRRHRPDTEETNDAGVGAAAAAMATKAVPRDPSSPPLSMYHRLLGGV